MYRVNDTVLYGLDGVCSVKEITNMDFGGRPAEYYVLEPVYNENAVIYVPVENESLVEKMHPVLTAGEMREVIQTMPDEEAAWVDNEAQRKEAFGNILKAGDRRELVGMIKSLYQHQQTQQARGRRLHTSDERYFKEAEKMLYDEIALVLGLEPEQVLPYLMKQLETRAGA